MKKIMAYDKHKTFSKLFLVVCLILFNAFFVLSCGLESFYLISAPVITPGKSIPTTSSDDISKTFYFDTTQDIGNVGEFNYVGTEVFYKIYSNEENMRTQVDKINSLTTQVDSNTTYAADLLIQNGDQGYGYRNLCIKDGGRYNQVLVTDDPTTSVSFRITDFGALGESHKLHFKVGKNGTSYEPCRYNGKPFNFSRSYKPDIKSKDSELDVYKVDEDYSGNDWFIAFYAITKGRDKTYTNFYSAPCYLGAVKIDGTRENN